MRGRRWTERSARDAAHALSPRGRAAQLTRLPTVSSWGLRWSPSTRVRAKRACTPARAHGPVRCPRSRWSMRLVPVTASQPTDHRAARRFGTRCIAPPRRLRSARAPSRVPATRTGSLTAISATSVSRLATSARVTERTDSSPPTLGMLTPEEAEAAHHAATAALQPEPQPQQVRERHRTREASLGHRAAVGSALEQGSEIGVGLVGL